ncbi:MAG: AAC(3) family N-acetyltransferase [Lachnospiraceae bacterium]|nr:AAC(3) family N-acetyltransferase [Lachnospiraceae bacterium]
MYTKNDLIEDLKKMGLTGTEAIMVHSSMKSIGEVDGGADTVVDAFMEFFQEGLFMTPTHTWAQMSSEYSTFNPKTEPACVGIIPNVFRQREGVVRSLHPTHSIAAYGKGAEEYIQGEENATSPCPPGGCWDRLKDVGAKILLLGVTHGRNTYIHSVDEVLKVQDRFTDHPTLMHIVMPDGSIKDVQMYRHYNRTLGTDAFSDKFDKMKQAFYDLGAAKAVKFGDADCILCDARGLFDVCSKLFAIEENCVIDREEIPEEWWKEQ